MKLIKLERFNHMEEILKQALNKMMEEVNELVDELNKNPLFEKIKKKKKFVNDFSLNYGGEIIYKDADAEEILSSGHINITPGQFKGSTLSKAVRWYLEQRGKENPPTYEEILEILKQGDYDGNVSDVKKTMLKNNQIVLLGKGTGVQRFGLTEWYPKRKKNSKGEDIESENDDDLDLSKESKIENKEENETVKE